MSVLVADASALVEYLLGTGAGVTVGRILRAANDTVNIPALCDVEVLAALRRALLHRKVSRHRVDEAVRDYRDLPLDRHGHQWLLDRMLELRKNFSAYDATYVALAEQLGARLLTADVRLARAVRSHTRVELSL